VLASTRAAGNGIDITKRVKHKMKVFELDWKKVKDGHVSGAKSDYWKTAEIELDKQVYLPIERFNPVGLFRDNLKELKRTLTDLELLGVDVASTPIYGVKAGVNTGDMVRVDKWALEQAKALPNLAREVAIIKDYEGGLFDFDADLNSLKKDSLAYDYLKQYLEAKKLNENSSKWSQSAKVRARVAFADLIQLSLPDKGKLTKLSEKFRERYPMLKHMSSYYQRASKKDVLDYINLVDEVRD
jgi:hypothetical protein